LIVLFLRSSVLFELRFDCVLDKVPEVVDFELSVNLMLNMCARLPASWPDFWDEIVAFVPLVNASAYAWLRPFLRPLWLAPVASSVASSAASTGIAVLVIGLLVFDRIAVFVKAIERSLEGAMRYTTPSSSYYVAAIVSILPE
jgi:hypothetical protein